MVNINRDRIEALGPAERIIETMVRYVDHMVHNRPGVISQDRSALPGVSWVPVTHKVEGDQKVVYKLVKEGKKSTRVRLGQLGEDGIVRGPLGVIGRYQAPGLVPEVCGWIYRQVAEVYKLDNEFAARWASWSFAQEHRDLKVVLAAFMLVQGRCGEPVREGGEVIFFDDDYRDIGEAMCLIRRKDGRDLNPKLLLRVGELLSVPEVAEVNRELGFGRSARNPALGRWPKAVERWLRHRERNPRMLQGLVKAGFRRTVMRLAQKIGYKPTSTRFFELLRWPQKQAEDGRRQMAIGVEVSQAETWEGLDERQICERIVATRPNYKRLVGLLPASVGLTRAVMAAAIEAGSVSDTDLIILTPTLEELGLLDVTGIGERWLAAMEQAENQRAANVARRVRRQDVADKLQEAADKAVKKAVEEAVRGLRVYVFVDKSGSMDGAIDRAKACLQRFLQGFPLDRTHVAVFNTSGREVTIPHASAAGVEQAFRGHRAGGGTDYGAGVKALRKYVPKPDEDALFLFVGDQLANKFADAVRATGINPVAFGMLHVEAPGWNGQGRCVEQTARELGVPCFPIDEATFEDPYAVTRTLRNLITSTPVKASASKRVSLVETILQTDMLSKPVWAAA